MGNLFAIDEAIFDVEANGVFNVLSGFFIGVALAIGALEGGASNEVIR
jgi:hypothetical protein